MKKELRVVIIKTDRSTCLLYVLGMYSAELILSKKKSHVQRQKFKFVRVGKWDKSVRRTNWNLATVIKPGKRNSSPYVWRKSSAATTGFPIWFPSIGWFWPHWSTDLLSEVYNRSTAILLNSDKMVDAIFLCPSVYPFKISQCLYNITIVKCNFCK